MLTALLDTSVLWPSLQRDFLLSLAIEGAYRPVWSSAILEELEFHEAAKLIKRGTPAHMASRRAHHLVTRIRTVFEEAEAVGWEPLEGTYGLPDPDDEHVLAAAVVAHADTIVTDNLRHFPPDRLPGKIRVLAPATFAASVVPPNVSRANAAVGAIVTRSGRVGPHLTEDQVFDTLAKRYGMTHAVEIIRSAA